MRDVDDRRPELAVQLDELGTHAGPQLRVEVREGLVEQEGCRLPHQRAAERDALPLPARKGPRLAFEKRADAQHLGRFPDRRSMSAAGVWRSRSPKLRLACTVMCG